MHAGHVPALCRIRRQCLRRLQTHPSLTQRESKGSSPRLWLTRRRMLTCPLTWTMILHPHWRHPRQPSRARWASQSQVNKDFNAAYIVVTSCDMHAAVVLWPCLTLLTYCLMAVGVLRSLQVGPCTGTLCTRQRSDTFWRCTRCSRLRPCTEPGAGGWQRQSATQAAD